MGEIAISHQVALGLVAPDASPIVRSLERQFGIFRRLNSRMASRLLFVTENSWLAPRRESELLLDRVKYLYRR